MFGVPEASAPPLKSWPSIAASPALVMLEELQPASEKELVLRWESPALPSVHVVVAAPSKQAATQI